MVREIISADLHGRLADSSAGAGGRWMMWWSVWCVVVTVVCGGHLVCGYVVVSVVYGAQLVCGDQLV